MEPRFCCPLDFTLELSSIAPATQSLVVTFVAFTNRPTTLIMVVTAFVQFATRWSFLWPTNIKSSGNIDNYEIVASLAQFLTNCSLSWITARAINWRFYDISSGHPRTYPQHFPNIPLEMLLSKHTRKFPRTFLLRGSIIQHKFWRVSALYCLSKFIINNLKITNYRPA